MGAGGSKSLWFSWCERYGNNHEPTIQLYLRTDGGDWMIGTICVDGTSCGTQPVKLNDLACDDWIYSNQHLFCRP